MKAKYHVLFWTLFGLMILSVLLPGAVMQWHGSRFGLLYCIPGVSVAVVAAVQLYFVQKHQFEFVAKLHKGTENAQFAALESLPFGLCVLNEDGIIVQMNPYFQEEIMDGGDLFGRDLFEIIPFNPSVAEQMISFQDRCYQVRLCPFREGDIALNVFLWTDVTELQTLREKYKSSHPCVLLIVIDNYEDLIQNAKESERLEASFAVERLLENFVAGTNGIVRRMKNDKFLAVLEEQHVQQLIENKFKILDDARNINVDERNYITFSIGVGHGAETLAESEAFAI
ncbi:MAG: hypothetical protein K6F80_05265, partial [Oscillospiraceae bacterium]|nr:hypothetical protein [Oscillospiraceae bacterium]